jgi:hypothetical protein
MASNVETSSVLNVNAAPTSGQLRKQPEPPKMPPSSDAADPDAAVLAERLPESTLGVTKNRIAVMLNEPPDQFVTEIDPTTKSLQAALGILGADRGFTTKIVTWRVMMEMREVVKQQPREQREAHWQRLLRYLQRAKYELPELPRQWPPDPGDETRNVREREYKISDVNVPCRAEQNVHAEHGMTRSPKRTDPGEKIWRLALKQTRDAKRMPVTATCASNVRSGESSSHTMVSRQDCAGQLPVKQEGAGAPNLAEQPCRQRTDLQQADGRLQSHSQEQVPAVPAVGLTGTSIFDNADSECIQLFGRSSDHRVTDANVGNEDKSAIDLRNIKSQGNPIRSPVEAHNDFAKPTTELVTNATDLSAQDRSQPEICDAALRTNTGILTEWEHFDSSDEEGVDDDMLPHTRAMQEARRIEHSGHKLGPVDQWLAFIERGMPSNPTVQQLHACVRHYSPEHLYRSVLCFNGHEDDEPFDMTVDRRRIPGRNITRAHMEMPDGVKCEQCEDGRIQAIGLQRDQGGAGDTEMSLAGSNETANGPNYDIKSAPECADDRAETSSAKRMRQACAGTVLEVQYGDNAEPTSCDGTSSVKEGPEPIQYNDAKVKLPVEASNTSEALPLQPFSVKPLAAHVALSVAKMPAEHAAQASSIETKTVQRDNMNAGADQQHGSNADRHAVSITVQK